MINSRPTVLTLSGHDPMQADIEAISAQGAHCAAIVTALTVQNSINVYDFRILDSEWVKAQADTVIADLPISAIKLGMLGSVEMVHCAISIIKQLPDIPVVCDPVLKAAGGGKLGNDDVGFVIREQLFKLSTIATPNLPEARMLADLPTDADADSCAAKLLDKVPYLLITDGDNLDSSLPITNRLYSKNSVQEFTCPRLPGIYHGSGCTLASALAAKLALGHDLINAAALALDYTYQTLRDAEQLGKGQFIPRRYLLS